MLEIPKATFFHIMGTLALQRVPWNLKQTYSMRSRANTTVYSFGRVRIAATFDEHGFRKYWEVL
jgi:hypothetical protein